MNRPLARTYDRLFLGMPLFDWTWLLLLVFWRLGIAGRLGLGVDEAHYVLYGMRVDWSYFDHPPLVGWVDAAFYRAFGQSELVARLPAILCGIVSTLLVYRLALQTTANRLAARAAALALNASFLAAALWIMFLPDTLLLPLALWLISIVGRIFERSKRSDWLELGLCLGLCGLSKYVAAFFVVSLVGFVASEKAWRRIRPLGALITVLLAAAIVSPVIIWNRAHDWISFKYQGGHVLNGETQSFTKLFLFIAGQLGAYSPFLIIAAAIGWQAARRKLALRARFALWIAVPMLVFFAYAALRDDVLPHWTLTAWGLLLPLGIASALASGWRKTVWWTLGATGAITVFLMAELAGQFLPFPNWQSPYADLTGWRELHAEIAALQKKDAAHEFSIAVPNWTLGSRANYYLADLAPVFVLDDRFDQFDLWEAGPPRTADLLVISWHGFELGTEQKARCQSIAPFSKRTFLSHGHAVNSVKLSWCRGYSTPTVGGAKTGGQ